jgi:anthranilate phosphoribosyltransferase
LIAKVIGGTGLNADESEGAFHWIMSGDATPVQIAALLVALRMKGHTPEEVAGGVRALRRAMVPVQVPSPRALVDTCGTGGGKVTTFNISTAASLVAAGGGVRVAKHGNRSFTSRSGSADVLEALGVKIQLSPEGMARVLDEAGIVFMFAPLLHPAMRFVAPVRKELGIPTIMNLLGPLTNPAGVRRQVVGVAEPDLIPLLIRALRELDHDRALVLHGEPGMDEISPLGPTRIAELREGEIREYEVTPESFGLASVRPEELVGGTPEENARIIEGILSGTLTGGARSAVLLNAAAAFHVGGVAEGLVEGVERARESIDSGGARRALEALRSATERESPPSE